MVQLKFYNNIFLGFFLLYKNKAYTINALLDFTEKKKPMIQKISQLRQMV